MTSLLDDVLSRMTGETPEATEGTAADTAPAPQADKPVTKKKLFGYGTGWNEEYGKKG